MPTKNANRAFEHENGHYLSSNCEYAVLVCMDSICEGYTVNIVI